MIDVHTHAPRDRNEWPLFLDECRRNGIGLFLVSGLAGFKRFPSAEEVHDANEGAKEFVAYAKGMARLQAYLNPQLDNWLEELQTCLKDGAIGIKLWVSLKDEQGRLDQCYPVLEEAVRRELPVLIHTFNRSGPNTPGEIDIEEFASLSERFPAAQLIAAHAGGNWRESLPTLRRCGPNAYIDICGSFPETGMLEALVAAVGPDRCLFGTDMLGRSLPSQLTKVFFAKVGEAVKQKVLWKNTDRLFRLDYKPVKVPETPSGEAVELPDMTTDHYCFCGRWPFFDTACPTPADLDRELARHDIEKAYVADLGSIYRIGLTEANRIFLTSARACPRISPLAIVDPRTHDWKHVLEDARTAFAGVFVSPYLHAWKLDDPARSPFFDLCAEYGVPLWVNCALHDWRFRHHGSSCRVVEKDELVAFCRSAPANRYVFQGATFEQVEAVLASEQGKAESRFEISRLTDGTARLARTVRAHGAAALVFGSEFPFRDMRTVRWTAERQALC